MSRPGPAPPAPALRGTAELSLRTMVLPYLGTVVTMLDVVFIFRKDHRCFHDHIAGTRVIVKRRS